MQLKFRCPRCGGRHIEEVKTGATVHIVLGPINTEGESHSDAPIYSTGGQISHFECASCELVLEDRLCQVIKSRKHLAMFLHDLSDQVLEEEIRELVRRHRPVPHRLSGRR